MPYPGIEPLGLESLALPGLRTATMPRRRQQQATAPEMTEEEESGLLSNFLGALGWLGQTLDKPGAALRGALAGELAQLLNAIPFSDTLGLTDENGYLAPYINQLKADDRVYGRDVLEAWGAAPANQEGFHPIDNPRDAMWDALGLATEVVADPLLAVRGPMGALTSVGLDVAKGAKFAKGTAGIDDLLAHATAVGRGEQTMGRIMGTTPKAIADEIRAGERGLMALRLPFAKEPMAVIGAKSERAAKLVENMYYSKFSPMMHLRGLFSKKVGGIKDPLEQIARDEAFGKLQNMDAMVRVAGETFQDRLPALEALWKEIGGQTGYEGADEMIRAIAETRDFAGKAIPISREEIAKLFDKPLPAIDEFAEQVHPIVNAFMQIKDMAWAKHQELGGQGKWLDSMFVNHVPRGVRKEYKADFDKLMRQYLLPSGTPFASRRNPFFDMPGGTITINRASRDAKLSGSSRRSRVDLENELRDDLRTLDPPAPSEWQVGEAWQDVPEGAVLPPGVEVTMNMTTGRNQARRAPLPSEVAEAAARATRKTAVTVDGVTVEGDAVDEFMEFVNAGMPTEQAKAIATKNAALRASPTPSAARATPSRYDDMPLEELQQWYLYHKYAAPELEKLAARGMDPAELAVAKERLLAGLVESVPGTTPVPKGAIGTAKTAKDLAAEQPLIPQLVEYLSKLPDEVRETGLFNRTTFQDWMDYNEHLAVSVANLSTIHNLLQNVIAKEPKGDDWVSLRQAVQGVIDPNGKRLLTDDAITYAVKKHLAAADPNAAATLNAMAPGDILKTADNLYVDPKTSQAIGKYFDIQTPEGTQGLGHLYDQFQSAFKFGVTLPWPAFHVRNRVDGFWRNLMRVGSDTYTMGELASSEKDLAKFRWGGGQIDELPFAREFIDSDILEGQHMADIKAAIGGDVEKMPVSLLETITGPMKKGYWDGEEAGAWWKPWNMRGMRAAEKTGKQNVAAEVGSRLHQWVEFANRYPAYAAARKHGLDPAQARRLVLDIQYDYSKLKGGALPNNFADTVARKVFPFWSFMQNNIPYQIGQLLNQPGGGHAQTLRFINQMHRANSEYIPGWLSERTAIRLPSDDDENASFLRQFGLSIEDLTRFSPSLTGRGLHRTASRFLADASPLITLPYRLLSGEDPFSGRPLKEMKGPTGLPWLDAMVMSTPASRGINTAEMIADPRTGPGLKTLNLLTGLKVGTYDLEKAKLYDLSQANREIIESDPVARLMSVPYVAKDKRENASPKTLEAIKRSAQINKKIKELIDRRKKESAAK